MSAVVARDLGPATEALIQAAFAEHCLLTSSVTAKLLGLDVKTLQAMTDDGVIRAVRRGAQRGYTEADIRTYLATPAPGREGKLCPSTNPRKAVSGSTTSRGTVVAFTALPASKRAEKRKR